MPPKKPAVSKKTVDKVAARVVEDKTFGLKNKNKSKKVQQFVESVEKQAKHAAMARAYGKTKTAEEMKKEADKKAKELEAALEKEMQMLLRQSVKQPRLDPGVDPKSVLCEYFKAGCCDKGDKCKFSHDLTIGRRAAKIDLYTDRREEETNADWDQAKLEAVVNSKHAAEASKVARTEIVCKYFLDAIEKEIYGWFWKCPNGEDCKYRHALPPGYSFKSKEQRELEAAAKAAEASNTVTIEEIIEEERRKLPTEGLTPVTAESFRAWQEKRAARRTADLEARRAEEAKRTGTKGFNVLSGRALFAFDPTLFVDDEGADDETYSMHDESETPSATAAGAGVTAAPVDEDAFLEGDDLDDLDIDDDEGEGEEDDEDAEAPTEE